MISILYGQPKKLASPQSIFVSFPYKSKIVDAIRMIPERVWDGRNKVWELDYKALSELKRLLPKEEFSVLGEPIDESKYGEKLITKTYSLPKEIKTKLYDYQYKSFNEAMNFDKYLFLLEAGLGKSIISISVALKRRELNQIKHCLIICAVNTIKTNYAHEIKKHTGLDSIVLGRRRNKKGMWHDGSTADKLKDLEELNEFFIITNIESLRNKEIKEKLKKYIDKDDIGMIVVDEVHRCFDYDTKILTNKGQMKIGDIVENKADVLVATYNEVKKVKEFKRIKNYFKHQTTERKMKLKICYVGGGSREIVCTENHLFYTHNRGWVKAKDLNEDDVLFNYLDNDFICPVCGGIVDRAGASGYLCCSDSCGAKWRYMVYGVTENQRKASSNNLKILWQDEEYRKRKSLESHNRMLENNPVYMEGVVEKAKRTRELNGSFTNNFLYGNGKMTPHEEKMRELLPSNFLYNYAISTAKARKEFPERHYSMNYKPDFVDLEKKLCIEVDGNNHKLKKIKALDKKKDECLNFLGYRVIRFTHEDIDSIDFEERLVKCLQDL